jgi:hypothetical protein
MFYEELYKELGRLFYSIAAADGTVHPEEKKTLEQIVQTNWKFLEDSKDDYGTDKAFLIDFAFDYEESEGFPGNGYSSFENFYNQNKDKFNADIIRKILITAQSISDTYRNKNKDEKEALDKLSLLLQN